MTDNLKRPADNYSPLYFLASLGAGGLSVSFFMFLYFWVPHKGQVVPIFEDLAAAFGKGDIKMQALIVFCMVVIAVLAFIQFKYLIWNLKQFSRFKKTQAYEELKNSNAETTLLAMPLTLAMAINVCFVLGLVYVPKLWTVVEYMFPLAMIAFGWVGLISLRYIGDFLGRVLSQGGVFDVMAHNSFAQLLPAFALSMVGVGFVAPAAMSTNIATVTVSMIGSTFFGVAAMIYAIVAVITAFNSMLHYGTHKETGPTLLMVIPIMTLLAILFLRQDHGLHATFSAHAEAADGMVMMSRYIAIQVVFLLLGLLVLNRQGYFKDFVFGPKTSPGSYALICPGVAISVLLHFFINVGLVKAGALDKFSLAYWALALVAIAVQVFMVWLMLRINKQHFGKAQAKAVPAE